MLAEQAIVECHLYSASSYKSGPCVLFPRVWARDPKTRTDDRKRQAGRRSFPEMKYRATLASSVISYSMPVTARKETR
jgi:hypothetical protein